MEYPTWLVVVMGMGIVFIGLICIIILSTIMSGIIRATEKNKTSTPLTTPATPSAAPMSAEKKGELVAAISCAIAEELGTSVEGIRINSIKRI